ncbi:acyltransferase [Novosphingobium sp. PASSN1]|uniref:acyltransferase family protein n=1 Tax=Novosphingobium sp. PASSN1 TaxID=2015561 RepID=UPI000BCB5099|nr:acyltransferase [Novosphingobium sp. PASSN1]OYU33248.1 MAG: acyltransferase [Novosphingobium sp. PASSN1]
MTSRSLRLEALTGLRGLAAWLVVLYHIRLSLAGLLPAPVIDGLAKGYLAVDLFFMLSGFVLWLTYGTRLAGGEPAALGQFWWRRVARIWPLHAAVLSGFMLLAAALAFTGRDHAGYPLGELPLHVLLVQNWGFTQTLAWNHPAWSISTEMAAYLMFPLLALSGRRKWSTAVLAGATGLLLGGLHVVYAATGHSSLGEAITSLGLLRCLIEFTVGTLAARLWLKWNDTSSAPRISRLCAAATAATLGAGLWFALPETIWVPLALLLVLLSLALAQGPIAHWLASGPVHWLGEVSYSTYLCHFGLFIVFKLLFVGPDLQLGGWQLAGFIGLLAVVSGLSHALIELPAQRALNALPSRLTRQRPLPG